MTGEDLKTTDVEGFVYILRTCPGGKFVVVGQTKYYDTPLSILCQSQLFGG